MEQLISFLPTTETNDCEDLDQVWDIEEFKSFKDQIIDDSLDTGCEEEDEKQKEILLRYRLEVAIRQWRMTDVTGKFNVKILTLEKVFQVFGHKDVKRDLRLVCELGTIETLCLSNNKLTCDHLPDVLFKLRNLKNLDLSHNSLRDLPLNFLRGNKSLEKLDVSHNNLRFLPAHILKLPNLTDLKRLNNHEMMSSFENMSHELRQRVRDGSISIQQKNYTLQTLCMQAALFANIPFQEFRLPLVIIKQLYDVASTLHICDNCLKIIRDKSNYFTVFPLDFVGLSYVPFRAETCSYECASSLFEEWDWSCREKEDDTQYVFDEHLSTNVSGSTRRKKAACCVLQ